MASRVRRRRPVVGGIVVGMLLLPSVVNIATGALPEAWARFAWLGAPVAVVLTVVLIVVERRARAAEAPTAEPPGGNQYNITGSGSTQIVSQHGAINVQLGQPHAGSGDDR